MTIFVLNKLEKLEKENKALSYLIGIVLLVALVGFIYLCAHALVAFSINAFEFIFKTFFGNNWKWF